MAKQTLESIKLESDGLRGVVPEELSQAEAKFSEAGKQVLKFHGIYQQHDRDTRGRQNRTYQFMIRSRLPGGRLSADQWLVHDALADEFGQGDMRLTTRQAIQLHGVIKVDLKATLQGLNQVMVTTLAACGDVARNVMCCPAPDGDPVRAQIQEHTDWIADHLIPHTHSYHEIWLENDAGKKERQSFPGTHGAQAPEEPVYGQSYLPRKFKIAFAMPGDNCTDILTNDVGLAALVDEQNRIHGYNLFVGGGMGQTHGKEETFVRLADPLGYVPVENLVDVVEKIVLVQRDHGDREDRRHARMKYLIHDWGIQRFRQEVEAYLGYGLESVRPMPDLVYEDHLGWHQQADGRWFLGLYVENGRVGDVGQRRLRSGLRALIGRFGPALRITPQQNLLLSGFTTDQRGDVSKLLGDYGIAGIDAISPLRRNAMACPALPTCGLAITESERYLPDLISELEEDVAELGLAAEAISIRMTGCPNGCARPYVADIGLVGQSLDKYALYLGGNLEGTRLNVLYRELVEADDLRSVLRQILLTFRANRREGERFGDWVAREGVQRVDALSLELIAA